jgi:hypothetical protein
MRRIIAFIFLFSSILGYQFRAQNGYDILKKMHTTFYKGPCKSYTFSQKNTHYKNDTVSGHSVWHEAIEFPDKFRIDFGEKAEGNYVVFRNDSVYNFKKNALAKMRADSNTLLLILGGLYYRNLEDVVNRLKAAEYKLETLSLQKWNSEEVYVIGALEGDLKSNQIWVNKKTLQVERILEKMNATDIMDMRFEAHQAWCKGSVETKVSFRRNGKLEQVEEYYDLEEIEPLRH